jgi:hypothetical protein
MWLSVTSQHRYRKQQSEQWAVCPTHPLWTHSEYNPQVLHQHRCSLQRDKVLRSLVQHTFHERMTGFIHVQRILTYASVWYKLIWISFSLLNRIGLCLELPNPWTCKLWIYPSCWYDVEDQVYLGNDTSIILTYCNVIGDYTVPFFKNKIYIFHTMTVDHFLD